MTKTKRYHDDLPEAELRSFLDAARSGDWDHAAWKALHQSALAWDVAHDAFRHDWLHLAAPEAGWKVLDLGSAYGGLALALQRLGCQVVPLEIMEARLELLRCRAKGRDEGPALLPCIGDSLSLPFRDSSFDAMTCIGVLEWLAVGWRLEEAIDAVHRDGLREMHRCLRKGGRLWVAYENPEGARYRGGAPEDHTGLPELMTLSRAEGDERCRHYTNQPFRALCRSWDESIAFFGEEGFALRRAWLPFPHYKAPRLFIPVEEAALSWARRQGARLRWDASLSPFDRKGAAKLAQAYDLRSLRRAGGAFLFEWEAR